MQLHQIDLKTYRKSILWNFNYTDRSYSKNDLKCLFTDYTKSTQTFIRNLHKAQSAKQISSNYWPLTLLKDRPDVSLTFLGQVEFGYYIRPHIVIIKKEPQVFGFTNNEKCYNMTIGLNTVNCSLMACLFGKEVTDASLHEIIQEVDAKFTNTIEANLIAPVFS